jgi:23S rRNA-/tRNA-specific pseudouridylate synthase
MADVEKFSISKLDNLEIVEDFSLEEGIKIDSKWLTVEGYIGRSKKNRFRMMFKPYERTGSKSAISHFLKIGEEKYLVKIDTGRMHQIRATFFSLGRFVKGDTLYTPGSRSFTPDSISLKSVYLSFTDLSGERKVFSIFE